MQGTNLTTATVPEISLPSDLTASTDAGGVLTTLGRARDPDGLP